MIKIYVYPTEIDYIFQEVFERPDVMGNAKYEHFYVMFEEYLKREYPQVENWPDFTFDVDHYAPAQFRYIIKFAPTTKENDTLLRLQLK